MTNSSEKRDSSVIMSSVMPSLMCSWSGSRGRFFRGKTAIDGLSGSARAALAKAGTLSARSVAGSSSCTSATKRNPFRGSVLITCWLLPSSPTAARTALMRVVSAESVTARPPQIETTSSSLLTTRLRLSTGSRAGRTSAERAALRSGGAAIRGGRCRTRSPRRRTSRVAPCRLAMPARADRSSR